VVYGWVWLKNIYQKDMCLKEIQLSAKNMITILGSIFNMVRGHVRPLNMHNYLHYDSKIKHTCKL